MTKTFRAAASSYFILGGLLSIPALIWIFGSLRGVTFDTEFALLVLALPLSVTAWLALFRLRITENAITYRSLFSGTRSARLSEIESIGVSRATPISQSPLNLEVRLHDGTFFVINVKPFPREATTMLLNMVRPNKPTQTTREDASQ